MAKEDGLTDPKLGKRILAETRLVRYERRVERAIKRVLARHKEHALKTLREQHSVTAASPPDSFGLYSFDTDVDDMVVPELGDVLGDIATGVANFLALPPEARAQVLGEIDVAARTQGFADKVKTIASDLAPRLMETLAVGVGKGEGIADLTKRIDDVFATGDFIAERIARTETHGAAEATTYESAGAIAGAGFEVTKSWLASSDDRVRSTHADADGQTVGMDEAFTVGDAELMFPGDPDGPPEEVINCFPGWIDLSGNLTAGVVRRVRVQLIEIITTDGDYLAATPNHPILTRRGWRPIGALQPGDELLRSTEPGPAASAVDPHVDDRVVTAEEAFEALALAVGRTERVAPGLVDLDGDVIDGEVEIQRPNSPLAFGTNTEQLKQLGELIVEGRHSKMRLADHSSSLLRIGHTNKGRLPRGSGRQAELRQSFGDGGPTDPQALAHRIDGEPLVPHRLDLSQDHSVSGKTKAGGLEKRSHLHPSVRQTSSDDLQSDVEPSTNNVKREQLDLIQANDLITVSAAPVDRCRSAVDSEFVETRSDEEVAHAESPAQFGGTGPLLVEPTDLVPDAITSLFVTPPHGFIATVVSQATRTPFTGNVYDFNTQEGLILANGIVSHNCRCSVEYSMPDTQSGSSGNTPDVEVESENV